jgi:hypothetical protein
VRLRGTYACGLDLGPTWTVCVTLPVKIVVEVVKVEVIELLPAVGVAKLLSG